MKIMKKSLAVILAIITIFTAFSVAMPVFATVGIYNIDDINDITNDEFGSQIVSEVTELRDECEKHFVCEDGSFIVATYSEPVHYKENGQWKEIDNRLKLISGKQSKSGKAVYTTQVGIVDVDIPKSLSDGQKVSATNKGYTISFGANHDKIIRKKQPTATVKDVEDLASSKITKEFTVAENSVAAASMFTTESDIAAVNDEAMSVDNQAGAVVYENVFGNDDLEYIVTILTLMFTMKLGKTSS